MCIKYFWGGDWRVKGITAMEHKWLVSLDVMVIVKVSGQMLGSKVGLHNLHNMQKNMNNDVDEVCDFTGLG